MAVKDLLEKGANITEAAEELSIHKRTAERRMLKVPKNA